MSCVFCSSQRDCLWPRALESEEMKQEFRVVKTLAFSGGPAAEKRELETHRT